MTLQLCCTMKKTNIKYLMRNIMRNHGTNGDLSRSYFKKRVNDIIYVALARFLMKQFNVEIVQLL